MPDLLSFGIASFHFGVVQKPPFTMKGREYLRDLEGLLKSSPNVSRVEITGDEDFENRSDDIEADEAPLSQGGGPLPHCGFSRIEFELYVPYRVQAELLGGDEEFVGTLTERFRVRMRYQYYRPVAFVELLAPTAKGDPAEAVRLVREFLKRVFDKPDASLRFEVLGPSPFHAECHIRLAATEDNGKADFTVCRHPSRAYDELIFDANPGRFDSLEEAAEAIYDEIADELDIFYEIVALRVQEMCEWEQAEKAFIALIAAQQAKAWKARVRNAFRWGKLIGDAFMAITTFEGSSIMRDGMITLGFRNQYTNDRPRPSFREFVENEMRERTAYPVKQTIALIDFIEKRRALGSQNLIRLLASIGAGIVGALLTMAFRGR